MERKTPNIDKKDLLNFLSLMNYYDAKIMIVTDFQGTVNLEKRLFEPENWKRLQRFITAAIETELRNI